MKIISIQIKQTVNVFELFIKLNMDHNHMHWRLLNPVYYLDEFRVLFRRNQPQLVFYPQANSLTYNNTHILDDVDGNLIWFS